MKGVCAIINSEEKVVALANNNPSSDFCSTEAHLYDPETDDDLFKDDHWYMDNYFEVWIFPKDAQKLRDEFESGRGVVVRPLPDHFDSDRDPYKISYEQVYSQRDSVPIRLGNILNN